MSALQLNNCKFYSTLFQGLRFGMILCWVLHVLLYTGQTMLHGYMVTSVGGVISFYTDVSVLGDSYAWIKLTYT